MASSRHRSYSWLMCACLSAAALSAGCAKKVAGPLGQGFTAASATLLPENTLLEANSDRYESSTGARLVHVQGGDFNRDFQVYFGPSAAGAGARFNGRGRYINVDPGWETGRGYGLLWGIKPRGNGQYVKAISDSTMVLMVSDGPVESVLVLEGDGAKVWLGNTKPAANNVLLYQVYYRYADGSYDVKDLANDESAKNQIKYLLTVPGVREVIPAPAQEIAYN